LKSNDLQADMPLALDASAKDLDNQLNNEMANAAISEMIDTTEKNSATIEARTHEYDNAPETLTEDNESNRKNLDTLVTIGDAQNGPPTTASNKKVANNAHFIPDATTNIPDEETVVQVADNPVRRPSSLINRISGLWTSKPNGKKAQTVSAISPEPAIDEAASKDQIAVSILDLSKPGIGNQDEKESPKSAQNFDDSELDIPAFLRRQAN
jgi:cell division protein FtsZ